ncbi:MAG: hypothetical protein JWO52_2945 [Gammaproteobacteria bacterium]|nr:hypothetical protein [Gammaproteobacteria bacterium]
MIGERGAKVRITVSVDAVTSGLLSMRVTAADIGQERVRDVTMQNLWSEMNGG